MPNAPPVRFELMLDLTDREIQRQGAARVTARILRLMADKIESEGLTPGGVWGGILGPAYWVVRASKED